MLWPVAVYCRYSYLAARIDSCGSNACYFCVNFKTASMRGSACLSLYVYRHRRGGDLHRPAHHVLLARIENSAAVGLDHCSLCRNIHAAFRNRGDFDHGGQSICLSDLHIHDNRITAIMALSQGVAPISKINAYAL